MVLYMDYFNIAKKIINKIKSCGYDAYIIGGAVRDYLLSLPVNDIDITTNMPLELLKELFILRITKSLKEIFHLK